MAELGKPALVLKIGGNQVEEDTFLAAFSEAVRRLTEHHSVVIVHGGGKEISDLHGQLGVPFETVEGLRATSEQSLRLVEMILCGLVNTRLVRWLVNHGVDAIGLSGVDGGLVRVVPLTVGSKSLGRVGQVESVHGEVLFQLLDLGMTPVLAPVSLGKDGLAYNVNADHVAAAVARTIEADRLVFVSNVPGVQVAGRVIRALTQSQVEDLIRDGYVTGGMVPKVRAALEAVATGVHQATITDLGGLASGNGTAIVGG